MNALRSAIGKLQEVKVTLDDRGRRRNSCYRCQLVEADREITAALMTLIDIDQTPEQAAAAVDRKNTIAIWRLQGHTPAEQLSALGVPLPLIPTWNDVDLAMRRVPRSKRRGAKRQPQAPRAPP